MQGIKVLHHLKLFKIMKKYLLRAAFIEAGVLECKCTKQYLIVL
jgi:hypothetical protein